MKQLFKKLFVVLALFLTVFSLQTNSVNALQSSRNYKTGYKSGQVIKKSYSYYGAGISRYRYVKTRDVYVSEKVYTDQWAKDVTNLLMYVNVILTEIRKSINPRQTR